MEPWKTRIATFDDSHVWLRGHDVAELMTQATFADIVFLLHKSRLPTGPERRLIDAMLISIADHGPGAPSVAAARMVASGNRKSPEAAVAAGVLAIGDAHAGAGMACFELLADAVNQVEAQRAAPSAVAARVVEDSRVRGARLPGFGHRNHSRDPRTIALLRMARELGIAARGVEMAVAIEEAVAKAIKPLPLNIDGAFAAVLHDMEFTPVMAKFIFMIGRVAGLTAEVAEEYAHERPMRIRIPVQYEGPAPAVREPDSQ